MKGSGRRIKGHYTRFSQKKAAIPLSAGAKIFEGSGLHIETPRPSWHGEGEVDIAADSVGAGKRVNEVTVQYSSYHFAFKMPQIRRTTLSYILA